MSDYSGQVLLYFQFGLQLLISPLAHQYHAIILDVRAGPVLDPDGLSALILHDSRAAS